MYAIIETGGKQYKVCAGDTIKVEKLEVEVGDKFTFDKVLFVGDKVGTPYVAGATVVADVLEQGKGKKVVAFKYKPKKAYKRKVGHRQLFTAVKIESINA